MRGIHFYRAGSESTGFQEGKGEMRGIHFYRAASNSIGFQAERRQERNAGDRMRGGDKRRRVYRIRGIQRGCRVSGGESRGTKEEHRAGSDSTGFQAGRGDRREMQEIG